MKVIYLFICFNLFLASFLGEVSASQLTNDGVYIVYMGASRFPDGAPRNDHTQLLSSLIKRNKNAVLHTYSNGFSGFAARLSEEEAKQIAKKPGVVSVFPDPVFKPQTTRSWDFLRLQSSSKIDYSTPKFPSDSSSDASDTIIGFLDTGIWPESKSFNDEDMGPIPSRWKGICMEGKHFSSSDCNRKLIGARYYEPQDTPRDGDGHGSHVASTAAGRPVSRASLYGLANGTAQGGSPGSRIAMYRVCDSITCYGSSILKGIDDSIGDGVDVISISLGSRVQDQDFTMDPIAIGTFHAMEKGIIVVCSAGNDGPYAATVLNYAPWIFTVAATTIDRDFQVKIVLGGTKLIKGGGINFSKLKKSAAYPLIDGESAKSDNNQQADEDAKYCYQGSLDGEKVKGKIVLCENQPSDFDATDRAMVLQEQGARGMILVDNRWRAVPENYKDFPVAAVTEEDGAEIISYMKSTSKPVATILPTSIVLDYKPAPVLAFFSARGPPSDIKNLIKPDISAPGVDILASWRSHDKEETLPGRKSPLFNIISGTSMSCPHVSGLAAKVKSWHPSWSSSAIRSAIMTTAIQTNNLNAPITTETGSIATAYDIGAGEINLSGPFEPGLVYETETTEYIQFLCNYGYDTTKINTIASNLPNNFSCPVNSNSDSISNMNYPSIAVSNLKKNGIKTVYRTVTNVGEDESTYTAVVEVPAGIEVEVKPNELQFTKGAKKMKFEVSFKTTAAFEEHLFGSITWSNDKYKVRSPFVVRSD